jgi:transposase
MLAALMAGERDPHLLALLAWGRLQRKPAARKLALQGQFTAHHARLMMLALEVIDLMNHQIAELDLLIGELITPYSTNGAAEQHSERRGDGGPEDPCGDGNRHKPLWV